MNLLPKTAENFSQKEYWESFFKKRGTKAFEWYGEYQDLQIISLFIHRSEEILMIGCGNSNLSMDMYDDGYRYIVNIDISHTVIKHMQKLNKEKRPQMQYHVMDALNMTFKNNMFPKVVDKGTLDALVSDDSPESLNRAEMLFNEIKRVTTKMGRYICISLLQEHILRKILSYFHNGEWYIRVERCYDVEKRAIERGEASLPVFAVMCTKLLKPRPNKKALLETYFNQKRLKVDSEEEILAAVKSLQQIAVVMTGLSRTSLSENEEIVFELFQPDNKSEPRFTIYIVDNKLRKNTWVVYDAFIVPQGREMEWLYSTIEGRRKLLLSTTCNRLAIITLHRGHHYFSMEKIQEELDEHVKNFAPENHTFKISYLSLENDLGERAQRHKGTSEISGPYVVEDVKCSNDKMFRRLVFLNSQNVVQSEVKLKTVKKKAKSKAVVDKSYIACTHHIYMGLGVHIVSRETSAKIVIVGLGGGGLCLFLKRYLPEIKITAIDIDAAMLNVAQRWFGLELNENMEVKIQDGLKFLQEEVNNGNKFDAILFDVDSKDTAIGMSCPPKEFLDSNVLDNVKKLINNTGIFILNLVLRDEKLRPNINSTLKSKFGSVYSYKIEEELNEIFYCPANQVDKESFDKNISEAVLSFNGLCKKKQIQNDVLDRIYFL